MTAGLAVEKYQMELEKNKKSYGKLRTSPSKFTPWRVPGSVRKRPGKEGEEKARSSRRTSPGPTSTQAFPRIEQRARHILSAMEEGDVLRTQLSVLRKLTLLHPDQRSRPEAFHRQAGPRSGRLCGLRVEEENGMKSTPPLPERGCFFLDANGQPGERTFVEWERK